MKKYCSVFTIGGHTIDKSFFKLFPRGKIVISGFKVTGMCHNFNVDNYCGNYDKFTELYKKL